MFVCTNSGGMCARTTNPLGSGWLVTPAQLQAPLALPLQISKPVGINGDNVWSDVTLIQRGLNWITTGDGGPAPALVVDGDCGRLTKAAIQKFQVKHFGWNQADGLIEPGRQTIQKLNELLSLVLQKPPTMEDLIRLWGLSPGQVLPDIAESFRQARGWILATQAALLSQSAPALMQKYFLSDQASVRQQLTLIFDRMLKVFQRPGGLWGSETFQPEPVLAHPSDQIAWCQAGGFFQQGKSELGKHNVTGQTVVIREDTIYVTFRFVLTATIQRSYAIVHELAHFVSNTPPITDFGYYHKGTAQTLAANLRLQNADCYAMLAFEAATGSSKSPYVWAPV